MIERTVCIVIVRNRSIQLKIDCLTLRWWWLLTFHRVFYSIELQNKMIGAAALILFLTREDMEERAINTYQKLMTKELFMKFTGFEEIKQRFPNIADVVAEVLKSLSSDVHGFEISDEEAEDIASCAWQKLRVTYQESE